MTTIDRVAARVLLVDEDGRLLLFHGVDPADPAGASWWFTVGGGVDPGESLRDGACRETFEETGLHVAPEELVGPVLTDRTEFGFDGDLIRQDQSFFWVRCSLGTVDTGGFDDLERRSVLGHRWWSLAELEQTDERVYPEGLAALLRNVLTETPR